MKSWLYEMEHPVLSVYILICLTSVVKCTILSDTFTFNSDASGKTCPLPDRIFTVMTRKKISCVKECMQRPNCKGVSYIQLSGLCIGCNGYYDIFSFLIDEPGSLFYAASPNIDGCRPPVVSDTHVVLGAFSGNSSVGSNVSYTCTPCTYFPPVEYPVITCQANFTWSTPECLYGPDVGHLANNDTIPPEEIGCANFYGDTCVGSGLSGNMLRYDGVRGNCFCDDECCASNDCCYDSTCPDTPLEF